MTRRDFLKVAAVAGSGIAAGFTSPAVSAPERTALRVVVFPGGFNWPIWIAQEKGFFAQQSLTVDLTPTPGSVYQLTHLLAGDFEIAHTAMDNVVAYDEGQGEVLVSGQPDLIAFMGGDNGFLRFVVRPEIQRYSDLRGRRLAVDALTTGYAFVLRKMLEANDLRGDEYEMVPAGGVLQRWEALLRGEFAGTLLVTPFEVLAQRSGLRVLGAAGDVLGPYQGVVGATRRIWAAAYPGRLVAYIRAYVAALAWLYDPARRAEATDILVEKTKLASAVAMQVYGIMVDPVSGFSPTATLDLQGIRTVLALRSRYAPHPRLLSDPARYFTLRYYNQAVGRAP